MSDKRVLAIIPARGGSKGLPRKNIREINGKPLIAWSIKAAKESKYIDMILVSTEDKEISDLSKSYEVDLVIDRPKALASDSAQTKDVIEHAMDFLETKGKKFDIVILLQPTSPLRTAEDIDGGLEHLMKKEADAIVGVCDASHDYVLINSLDDDMRMENFIDKSHRDKPRQELKRHYKINGALYIAKYDFYKERKDWYSKRTFAYIMDKTKSIDIDSEDDLFYAEYLMAKEKV